ncbi:MAG: hypothetical protein WC675_02560 [Patescibacteria group bacterium]|jgi:uncharacterized membrane protein YdbT with pleckstrin-like domain
MRNLSVVIALVAVLLISTAAHAAQQVTIDLDKLTPEAAAELMKLKKAAENPEPEMPTAEQLENYVDLGAKIGQAIAATCKELSVEVNEFVRTPVGMITMGLIIWKVAGTEIWGIVGGTSVWVVITLILMWSFHYFHMSKKVKGKEGDEWVRRYEFSDWTYEAWSAGIHLVCWAAITITCLVIVFYH